MPMPKQLSQISILQTRYPPRKAIFQQQLQQELSILTVRLLLPHSLGSDLGWVSNAQFETQFRQLPLEPACMPGGFHLHSHADSLSEKRLAETRIAFYARAVTGSSSWRHHLSAIPRR